MDTKSLSQIILKWRLYSDLSQQELAEKAGLSRKIISGIETGARKSKRSELVRICHALGKPVAQLVEVWSEGLLVELEQEERKLYGPTVAAGPPPLPLPESPAPVPPSNPEPEPGLSAEVEQALEQYYLRAHVSDRQHFQEFILALQKDTLRQVAVMIARVPDPPAPSSGRPRMRVSRKGRVKPRE